MDLTKLNESVRRVRYILPQWSKHSHRSGEQSSTQTLRVLADRAEPLTQPNSQPLSPLSGGSTTIRDNICPQTLSEKMTEVVGDIEGVVCLVDDMLVSEKNHDQRLMTVLSHLNEVLYWMESDSILRMVLPQSHRERLFKEMHNGRFGAHLSATKVHSELRRHYWWPGMRRDITQWTSLSGPECV